MEKQVTKFDHDDALKLLECSVGEERDVCLKIAELFIDNEPADRDTYDKFRGICFRHYNDLVGS